MCVCVCVCVCDNINSTRRIDLETSDIESVWLEIKLKNSKSFYFVQYTDLHRQNPNGSILFPCR